MSNQFIWIYSGGGGVKFMKHVWGGGGQDIKGWEPRRYGKAVNACERSGASCTAFILRVCNIYLEGRKFPSNKSVQRYLVSEDSKWLWQHIKSSGIYLKACEEKSERKYNCTFNLPSFAPPWFLCARARVCVCIIYYDMLLRPVKTKLV
jgi:hypothetical protein